MAYVSVMAEFQLPGQFLRQFLPRPWGQFNSEQLSKAFGFGCIHALLVIQANSLRLAWQKSESLLIGLRGIADGAG